VRCWFNTGEVGPACEWRFRKRCSMPRPHLLTGRMMMRGSGVRIHFPPGESRVRTCMLAEVGQTGESQISLTDPDSRAMAAPTHVAVGYDVQIAVDAKH
jgi:hypothetical protein